VRRILPELINLVWNKKINLGKVFDLTLPLDQVAQGCRAMGERRAIKPTATEEIRPDDVVRFPPNQKRWHGATPTTTVTHITIQEKLDGKSVSSSIVSDGAV
jgi:hypothetical protein